MSHQPHLKQHQQLTSSWEAWQHCYGLFKETGDPSKSAAVGLGWALSQYTENPHAYLGPLFIEWFPQHIFFATLTNIKWQTHQLSAGALDLTIHQAHHTHNVHWTRHQDGTRPTLQPTHKTYKAHQTYQTKHTQGLTKHDPVHSVNYAKAGPFAPLS